MSIPHTPLELGYLWLEMHNPRIDWANHKVAAWSLLCLLCLQSAPFPTKAVSPPKSVSSPDRSCVPTEYHDLKGVFSKELPNLLPHCPYDCTINMLPGASLPTSPLYSLSRPEWEAMETYIRDSLNAGIICPSLSPVGARLFFFEVQGPLPSGKRTHTLT